MESMAKTDALTIMERTLNYIDSRLVNHGRRVAHIVYHMLKPTGKYSEKQLQDICIAALLHDIGAYKTEEVDKMVSFETKDTWDHSIYGYLFFKHFSPLPHLAETILHHHSACADIDFFRPELFLAQVIFVADRLDVYMQAGINGAGELFGMLEQQRDILFFSEVIDLLKTSGVALPVLDQHVFGDSAINRVLHSRPLSSDEVLSYLKMIVLFIDFRSHQTLSHTITTASISESLAELLCVDEASRRRLVAGSWLHDIGKTGIPLDILEKPSKLTAEEKAVIQRHVSLTDDIIKGCVIDDVRRIAIHHHEKMDGSGYPHGLQGNELPICERIAVVSDIFSALSGVRSYKDAFPKEGVVAVLQQMRDDGLLDPEIVRVAVDNYETIMYKLEEDVKPFQQKYTMINREFWELRDRRSSHVRHR